MRNIIIPVSVVMKWCFWSFVYILRQCICGLRLLHILVSLNIHLHGFGHLMLYIYNYTYNIPRFVNNDHIIRTIDVRKRGRKYFPLAILSSSKCLKANYRLHWHYTHITPCSAVRVAPWSYWCWMFSVAMLLKLKHYKIRHQW